MKIKATVDSKKGTHTVNMESNGSSKALKVESGFNGYGSSVNGGEFLLLAIATCFCNDIYREARKKNIEIYNVQVVATGEFSMEGAPGYNLSYRAKIQGNASDEALNKLMIETDKVSEIHNTLRQGVAVTFSNSN